jgi:antitoxin component of RelBE/YafQ-DinJ toxin-antitoxin module
MTYIIQIDDEVREATKAEAAEIDAREAEAAKAEADRKAKEQARAAVLAKLGLTADEAAALLG